MRRTRRPESDLERPILNSTVDTYFARLRCLLKISKGIESTFSMHTWSSKYPDQLRRAAAIVAYRNDIAQWTLLVLSDRLENVDKVVCSTTAGKDNYAFGLDAAVGHLHRC